MRKAFLLLLVLVGCSDSNNKTVDAAPPPPVDAAAPAPPDCTTYCNTIQANCTGANAQYPDMAHCMGACGSFAIGKTGDQTGNTLGCRLSHAGALATTNATTNCPLAGPGGALTSLTTPPGTSNTCGDACTSFCTLDIKACGTTTSVPATGQYVDMNDCLAKCAAFPNSDHLYSITSGGDSLACRLYHSTNAAVPGSATVHCPHTGPAPAGLGNPCLAGKVATP